MAIKDWPGGVISKTPVVPDGGYLNSAASGVWTLDQAAYWTKQQQWPGTAVGDPYFYDVSLLLTGDGTNGAQNNTFLDSSTNNFTITRNGNTTQGTFSPYGNLWSNYLYDAYITASLGAAGQFGTGDFTVECWINPSAGSQSQGNVIWTFALYPATNGIYIAYANDGSLTMLSGGLASAVTFANALTFNTWQHIAVSRSGTSLRVFVNGSQVGSTITNSVNLTEGFQYIGRPNDVASYYFRGYISNFRAVKGTALYTSNFTPSTTPLTAVSGTSLLTCQSNRFIDNSSNNFTLTRNGDVKVQRFSPFNPTAPYDAATIGGSGYFDGTGDYLSAATNTAFNCGTGNFTIEAWVNIASYPGSYPLIIGNNNGSFSAGALALTAQNSTSGGASKISLSAYDINSGAVTLAAGATNTLNSWIHVALVRNGTSLVLYINGTSSASTTISAGVTFDWGKNGLLVGGGNWDGANSYFAGYISNLRVVKGTAVYTTAFTPPTAPLTAITNTSLLCNFTNAGIPDAAMMNDLETVGNAQVSTSVKKYGTGSLAFDGSGDYLVAPYNPAFDFNTGDFTIECWIYLNSIPVNDYRQIVCFGTSSNTQRWILLYDTRTITGAPHLAFYSLNSSNTVTVEVKGGGSSGWSANTWYHVAITRQGNSFKLFRDGVQNGSTVTDSDPVPGTPSTGTLFVGSEVGGTIAYFNGYIDDLRITKGYARYTANFTPPTAAFPTF